MRLSPSSITKKREVLSRDARIQSILAASQRVFSRRPYDEISIDEIAAEASMSKGLLYHYFASKRDLYLETLRSVFATMQQIPEDFHDLRGCLNAFLACFEQSPDLARMVFRGGIGSRRRGRGPADYLSAAAIRAFFPTCGQQQSRPFDTARSAELDQFFSRSQPPMVRAPGYPTRTGAGPA